MGSGSEYHPSWVGTGSGERPEAASCQMGRCGDSGGILRAVELAYWRLSPLMPAPVVSRGPRGTLKGLFSSILIPDCCGLGMPHCANIRINLSQGALVLGRAREWAVSTSAHASPTPNPRPVHPLEPGERRFPFSLFLSVMPSVKWTSIFLIVYVPGSGLGGMMWFRPHESHFFFFFCL